MTVLVVMFLLAAVIFGGLWVWLQVERASLWRAVAHRLATELDQWGLRSPAVSDALDIYERAKVADRFDPPYSASHTGEG